MMPEEIKLPPVCYVCGGRCWTSRVPVGDLTRHKDCKPGSEAYMANDTLAGGYRKTMGIRKEG